VPSRGRDGLRRLIRTFARRESLVQQLIDVDLDAAAGSTRNDDELAPRRN
jgi:hypothetical protein